MYEPGNCVRRQTQKARIANLCLFTKLRGLNVTVYDVDVKKY